MRVAVGCPIHNRAWIFAEYVEHVHIAFDIAGLSPIWIFNVGVDSDGSDDGTRNLVAELLQKESGIFVEANEPDLSPIRGQWNGERYRQMATYRNQLLALVRTEQPDYFLSLDSDILLHPTALLCLVETITHVHEIQGQSMLYDAVGGKAFLSEGSGSNITTYASGLGQNSGLIRQNADGVFPVQILMAIKLMSPAAYQIPYEYNQWGEDISWSLNCGKAGLRLGWDGRVSSKHVMRQELLNKIDPRVGW